MKRVFIIMLLAAVSALPARAAAVSAVGDSVEAPAATDSASAMLMPRLWMPEPFYLSPWQLHEGLNAQMGMSVSVGFGRHAPRGAGIGSSMAFVYAKPVGDRLSLTGGVSMDSMNWGSWRERNATVAATAGYRVSDCLSLYAFGSHSLTPRSVYGAGSPRYDATRWGGGAEMSLGKNVFIQVGVSGGRADFR